MIDRLKISNFKSHKDTRLELKNLTVLSGQNGVGKSSLIQSLLLLRQTNTKSRLNEILDLNEPLCYIGKTKDALYQFLNKEEDDEICFVLADSTANYSWAFDTSKESTYLRRTGDIADSAGFEHLSLFKDSFQYVSASRNLEYKTDDYAVEIQKQLSIKEGKGELTAQFLFQYQKNLKILPGLKHGSENDDFLLSQTTAWEREISKGVNIMPDKSGENYEVRYSFDTSEFGPTDPFSQKNVGYGLSYSLPIIVAILSSQKDALLLIENPEAHIHPYGQAKLAELICLAAEAGIQLIVETHSDHIINGILVQCKNNESGNRGINKNNLKIYHFDRDEKMHSTVSTEVEIDTGGRIKNRPQGFFDQMGKDIRKLI